MNGYIQPSLVEWDGADMSRGTIIFLNGVSSSGKTTLTQALQDRLPDPYYKIDSDTFNHMAPRIHRNADFRAITNKSMSAMHHTVALFSDLGLNVIVDHVILDTLEGQASLHECVRLLHMYPVLFVRVTCSLEELERREQQRGNRRRGQARSQVDRIHGHGAYDLTVDTSHHTPETCADMIMAALGEPESWRAFRTLYERWI